MKALVVTNCATAAYTSGLQALFPDWEVKGVNFDVAQKWLGRDPNGAFRDFLTESNLLVLGSENEAAFAEYARGKDVLSIPYFYFRGLHPDSFHLGIGDRAVPSVLRTGNLHSRLAVAAFLLGLTRRETVVAFDGGVYERAGYFSLFDGEVSGLFERFAQSGIDLAPLFARWRARGNFLYTYNHPHAFVFNEILLEALCGRFLDGAKRESARAALASVPDYLAPSVRWPIYPEIAARHGVKSDFLWRTGTGAGALSMTVAQFIDGTFDILESCPDLDPGCVPGFAAVCDALRE